MVERFDFRPVVDGGGFETEADAIKSARRTLERFPEQMIGVYKLVALVRATVVLAVEEVDDYGA